ncbi:MAG: 5'-methylthioadenosine/adenosylhomocysteine nucleosidase [Prevotella sp.]|jgi:adenosylhomocysteine nucleosidase|nr:5'-methylthioadenosine/adenosylhomocysteine nucleosidase [Prevotella sp.]MCI1742185.1 5'-methylthioadenosine/adenosylhomocysteine nucleosidase [Prevotella sp.]
MRIGIIVAMNKEFTQLETLLDNKSIEQYNHKDFVTGTIGDKEIVLQQCGIGKVNSTIGTVEMIDHYHPELVISTGCAGGADIQLNPLDIVVASECTYHDAYCGKEAEYGQIMGMPVRYKAPKELIRKALSLNDPTDEHDEKLHVRAGLTVSGEWFVDSKEKMKSILRRFPQTLAVDMESCSIAQTCHIYQVPFLSFRIISDVPLKDDKAAQYFDFWNKMANGSFQATKTFLERL